jgi:hypothetical protein
VVAPLALVGCGKDAATVSPATSTSSSGDVLPGGGLSVAEAISTDAGPPLAVGGWVVGSGSSARLCSGYDAGANDPCVEPSLVLKGARSMQSGTRVSLLGAVKGDTFEVSSTVQG